MVQGGRGNTFIHKMYAALTTLLALLPLYAAHSHHQDQIPLDGQDPWAPFAGTPDLSFSGLTTFAHLPGAKCLDDPSASFDIALLGIPFDTAVSFRSGARFGPYGLRSGSRRQRPDRGYSSVLGVNPYTDGFGIVRQQRF
jgi:agmatinase